MKKEVENNNAANDGGSEIVKSEFVEVTESQAVEEKAEGE